MRTFSRMLNTPLYAVALAALVAPVALAAPSAARPPTPSDLEWSVTAVDADQSFRGLDAVDRDTAWVSGASVSGGDARIYLTQDGGTTWDDVSPTDSAGLNFRDVEAEDARTATVLAIGEGEASRIYRTTDGGTTWTETFRNTEPTAFYNCMDFYPGGKRGLAVSDPVDGKFRIISTDDGGRSWSVLPDAGMPDSTGEANFSASGDCLTISGHDAWFGSGGAQSRIFHSTDRGLTWTATDSTIPAGEAAGVFGLAFKNPRQGIAVGGDFAAAADGVDASATTRDGKSWTSGGDLGHLGEDAAYLRRSVVVVGESGPVGGSSVSTDGGRSWEQFSEVGFHTLDCTNDGACWAAGGKGRVGTL
ncbi:MULTISPECIES: WD40/YVTN/BNR-like repeat-containing protein [unclassified Knoellia]|uniref:WD40/YVTN/BNR-like repeat-containing protein n=1 Tax=Knoellia altitudinis TaxID=3404795 RepID=UPI00361A2300